MKSKTYLPNYALRCHFKDYIRVKLTAFKLVSLISGILPTKVNLNNNDKSMLHSWHDLVLLLLIYLFYKL